MSARVNGSSILEVSTYSTTTAVISSKSIWSNTLIVVVAVGGYFLLCIFLCVVYRCAKKRGMPGDIRFRCCSSPCCGDCECLNKCNEKGEETCTWCKNPVPTFDSVLDKCCPRNVKLPQCEDLVLCKGMNLNCPKLKWNKEKPEWYKKWFKNQNDCLPGKPLFSFCSYESGNPCCGYGGGNCKCLCLECKVRTREVLGNPAAATSEAQGPVPYPMYQNGTPIYFTQPGVGQAFAPPPPGLLPMGPSGQAHYFNAQRAVPSMSLAAGNLQIPFYNRPPSSASADYGAGALHDKNAAAMGSMWMQPIGIGNTQPQPAFLPQDPPGTTIVNTTAVT